MEAHQESNEIVLNKKQSIMSNVKGVIRESIEIGGKKYNFSIFSPGGNDTCFIEGILENQKEKKELNDKIMSLYPNVEQVGFIDMTQENPRLEMAGGEFCGNATRSFAYKFLDGKEGYGEFQISGVENKLLAGVTKEGEAWAQMPIYKDLSKIQEDQNNKGNYIVEMEGISHYVSFGNSGIDKNDEKFIDKIKEKSLQKIKELGLDNGPAAGIMYVTKQGDNRHMEPVVYVKSIDTLFYETACGSGTTAVGMVLSAKEKQSIENTSIIQPSGESIKISVKLNEEKSGFEFAKIQGVVKQLQSGTFEKGGEIPFVIERVKTTEELKYALNEGGLIRLYQDIFSKAPYFEKFSDEEVEGDFTHYLEDGVLFINKVSGRVIGFGAAVPLSRDAGVADSLKDVFERNGWDIKEAWYMADLGINEEYRGHDLAKRLVLQRLQSIPKGSIIIMRTSINNEKSRSIYQKFGFEELHDVYQKVEGKRQDDAIKSDKRRFSYAIK